MNNEKTVLVSSDELRIIAAASGLKSFLIFQQEDKFERIQQIQAVYHLLRDDLLTQGRTGITVGESLRSIVLVLQGANTVVTVRGAGITIPPISFFSSKDQKKYVYVVPSKSRHNTYRIGIATAEEILELLEQMRTLPIVLRNDFSNLSLPQEELNAKIAMLDDNWSINAVTDVLGNSFASLFEKYNLSDEVCTDRLLVCQASLGWVVSRWQKNPKTANFYCRELVVEWIRSE